jgi:hypothetical protein
MLSEQTQAHVGWFVGCLSFVWLFLSRRLVAWIGAAVVAGYCARWGAAFSAGRRAANLITDLTKRAVFITGYFSLNYYCQKTFRYSSGTKLKFFE